MSAPAFSVVSPAAQAVAARLDLRMGRANLEVFAETLLALAQVNRQLLVVTSDSRGSGKLGPFAQALPQQIVEVGIAEQNLVGIAAGLAAARKKVVAVSAACFFSARSLGQIQNDVGYLGTVVTPVWVRAVGGYGSLGSS